MKAKINLVTKEILGKELKIDFVDNYFGIPNNDPILKGRLQFQIMNKLRFIKQFFHMQYNFNKSCPGWETEEFTHDKVNKVFNYKNF